MSTTKKMEMKMARKTDWSGLDDLALDEIAGRIPLYRDVAALCMVFEVDLSTNSWTKMKDLGNQTLFLDKNSSSICIESDGVYFKPNRIFFMDRYNMDAIRLFNKRGGTNVRIYNIEDGIIESYFSGDPCNLLTPYNDWNPAPLFVEQCF
ncbi:hypothetical protein QYF36_014937 [Acer negundo]|nr:hypothetical protein QYF36_014937 [Acer negundo]